MEASALFVHRRERHVAELYVVAAEMEEDPDKRNDIVSNERIEATGFKSSVGRDRGDRRTAEGLSGASPQSVLHRLKKALP